MSGQRNTLFVPERNAVPGDPPLQCCGAAEEAFAALVRQHINFVFATAVRQVGDRGAAEEITQNVFFALAQASDKLKSHPTIAGWLHRTTLNKSREWLRSELRRRRREQIAFNQDLARSEGDSVWSALVPLLDEALLGLREPDRLAVIMHYMEGQTFHEVGSALGIGEDTARKRVNRCLEKLTHYFRRHGFAVPGLGAGAPLFALSSHAAPSGLAKTISVMASAKGAAASTSTSTSLIKGALKFMAWTKTKSAIAAGIGLLVVAGTVTVVVKEIGALQTPVWQKQYDLSFVDKLPPQVKILPSLPSTLRSGLHAGGVRNGKGLALGQSIPDIVMAAYGVGPAQLIWNAAVPGAVKYDVLANLPGGNTANFVAIQKAIPKTFGLAARYETIKTNALILAVKFPNAPGLRAAVPGEFSGTELLNSYSAHGQGIGTLVDYLESCLGIVVVDQTQMKGDYNIDFQWDGRTREGLEKALLDQAGLELIHTNQPVRMLLVEKAK